MDERRQFRPLVLVVLLAALVTVGLEGATPLSPGPGASVANAQVQAVEIEVSIPQIDWLQVWDDESRDLGAVDAVNKAIRQTALEMVHQLAQIGNVWGDFDVHLDRPDLLSVTMQYSGYMPPMAHPMHFRASVTADPTTGRIYKLSDLFDDEGYVDVLSKAVTLEIQEQELPLLVEFDAISPDQDFYLTESHLVLYYQLYDLVPYAWGFPEFRVPLTSLTSVAKEDGPILVLLGAK